MKIKVENLLFYVTYILVILLDFLTKTQFIAQYPVVSASIIPGFILTTFLLIVTILLEHKVTVIRLVYMLAITIFSIIIARMSGNYQKIITIGLLLLAIGNKNIYTILKIHLFTISLMMMLLFASYKLGILPGGFSLRDNTVRYYLGFSYTSYASNYLFHLIITAIFVYKEKLNFIIWLIFLMLNQVFFDLTDTKSAYYLSLLVLLLFLIVKNIKDSSKIEKISKYFEKFSFPVFTLIILLMTKLYDNGNNLMERVNELLTYRLMLGAQALREYGISIFGTKIVWSGFNSGKQYLYVDSSFLNILLNYGVVLVLLFSLGYYLLGKKNIYRDKFYFLSFVFLMLHSLFDPQFIEISYNPFILFLGLALLSSNEIEKIKLDVEGKC